MTTAEPPRVDATVLASIRYPTYVVFGCLEAAYECVRIYSRACWPGERQEDRWSRGPSSRLLSEGALFVLSGECPDAAALHGWWVTHYYRLCGADPNPVKLPPWADLPERDRIRTRLFYDTVLRMKAAFSQE